MMCNKRNSRRRNIRGKIVRLDACIADLVADLNDSAGIRTVAACCGHGKYPATIVYKFDEEPAHWFRVNGLNSPLTRRKFYRRDKNGLFFIPEVGKL